MLYLLHEMAYYSAGPWRAVAQASRDFWGNKANPISDTEFGRKMYASAELFSTVTRRYGKPDWRLDNVEINGTSVRVQVVEDWASPWCKLIRFQRDPTDLRRAGVKKPAPAVLVVAPLSGHYATLLRGTVQEFLLDHDVYVTDWVNARQVPVLEGRFDFYSFIDHVRDMLRAIGARAHVVAVCQPGPPVLAAACLMSEDKDPLRPASMTFMGSPIDARYNPTVTNDLAQEKPFTWFKSNMVHTVPPPYPGVGRRVYPGFVQLYSFMSMNEERHKDAHWAYFNSLVDDDGDGIEKHLEFYDEYLSVLDLTEEFYLQTIDLVFQKFALPKGELIHHGRPVRLEAVTDIALMTVEGEKDDISGVGQTQAAHEMCKNIPQEMRELYVQPGAGHYGVFNGRRFRQEIYPRIRDFIARSEAAL
ncbi:polyhydroxyalkanoate depolymerase [Asticcacaulis excentricus]|uniref:Polyhydroxyalkanoate depolymerase, intracellular n=1 Tax=Asticcacaulis excentricus (strain ATCC 15261 / DSM 4724 / KCTC 12464 / NCIMB 9791 / VKM B-1370 / CB 48) TaxID=573065 RepID=E8RP77_ASTEC|nr:polyhydroxyalkanoate depolymerase [Asticcacaulis excentricus]ADU11923.1 polyhydroxyalkanoate depolymerase, intracellular [Asticcacaulis excentricus CB 48]